MKNSNISINFFVLYRKYCPPWFGDRWFRVGSTCVRIFAYCVCMCRFRRLRLGRRQQPPPRTSTEPDAIFFKQHNYTDSPTRQDIHTRSSFAIDTQIAQLTHIFRHDSSDGEITPNSQKIHHSNPNRLSALIFSKWWWNLWWVNLWCYISWLLEVLKGNMKGWMDDERKKLKRLDRNPRITTK